MAKVRDFRLNIEVKELKCDALFNIRYFSIKKNIKILSLYYFIKMKKKYVNNFLCKTNQ